MNINIKQVIFDIALRFLKSVRLSVGFLFGYRSVFTCVKFVADESRERGKYNPADFIKSSHHGKLKRRDLFKIRR